MMKRVLSVALALTLVLSLAACGSSSSSEETTAAAEETTEAAAEGEETEAAETEAAEVTDEGSGTLVIYSPNSDTEIDNVLAAFEEKYPGIDVQLQSMGTGDCLTRLDAEKENPQADVMWGGVNYTYYTQYPDLWEEYVSPNNENVDDNYKNDTGYVTYYTLSGSACFLINDDLLDELGIEINGYADLLQPELKGKIAFGDPTASASAWAELTNMLLVMGGYDSDEAWDYVDSFVQNLDGIIQSSSSQVYKSVIDGEYVVGVSYEDPCVSAIIDNEENPDVNLSIVYPEEGAVWLPAGVAIVKNCADEDNAKLFVDWLISDEAQTIINSLTMRGTVTTIPSTNSYMASFDDINVAYEDIPYCAEHQTEWLDKWTDILTSY